MRTNYNRQARRAGLCIRAGDGDLARVAARIAQELELSPEAIDSLLWRDAAPKPAGRRDQSKD